MVLVDYGYVEEASVVIAPSSVVVSQDDPSFVVVTNDPVLTPSPQPGLIDTKALDLLREGLYNSSDNPLGIENEWSIQMNIEPGRDDNRMYLFRINPISGSNSLIAIHLSGQLVNNPIRVAITGTTGGVFKDYYWNNTYTAGTKVSYIVTWDGTNLLLYVDGVLTAVDTLATDNTGTMEDIGRKVSVCSVNGSVDYTGLLHSTSMWNVTLTQSEITTLQNGMSPQDLDNRFNFGDYVSANNLQHYWRHGFDATDIGKDHGNADTLIDIGDNAINVDPSDIVDY